MIPGEELARHEDGWVGESTMPHGWTEDVRVDPERARPVLGGAREERGEHPDWGGVDRRLPDDVPGARADPRALAERTSTGRASGEEPRHDAGRRGGDLGAALVRGAIAGAIGALAMVLTHKGSSKVLLGSADAAPQPGEQMAGALAERAGRELPAGAEMAAGTGVSVGYGALLGAVYGVVHETVEPPALLHSLLLGGLSYAVTVPEWGLLPKLGLMPPPSQQSIEKAIVPMDAHLAYGVATAAAFEALR